MQLRNGKTYIYKEKDLYDCKESKPLSSGNGIFNVTAPNIKLECISECVYNLSIE